MKTKKRKPLHFPPLPNRENPSERWLKFEQLTYHYQLVNHLMYLDDLTPALMAKRCRMPEQKIKAIAELKHRITSKIASCFERCFGWPAHVLLTWQLVYDIEERLYHWEDRFQEHFEMHVYGQEFFLARIKSDIKLLKMDRRFLQKLLPARLRKKR